MRLLRYRSIRELVDVATPDWTPFQPSYYNRPIRILVEKAVPRKQNQSPEWH